MSNPNSQIRITLDAETGSELAKLAEGRRLPVSALAASLIREAPELQEDRLLSDLSNRRISEDTGRRIAHKDAWRQSPRLPVCRTAYQAEYAQKVVTDDMPALPGSAAKLIKRAIETRLMRAPLSYGKPLRYGLMGRDVCASALTAFFAPLTMKIKLSPFAPSVIAEKFIVKTRWAELKLRNPQRPLPLDLSADDAEPMCCYGGNSR